MLFCCAHKMQMQQKPFYCLSTSSGFQNTFWIVVLEDLRAWFNKNNFPSRSQLPSHQAEAQAKHLKCSIVVLLVLFGDQHLANSIQRGALAVGIAEQIQPVPPTAPPRLSQQTLYLSHFLP